MLRDHHGLEAVDVPATHLMETPPLCETLLMPVYRRQHQGLECYPKTNFGPLPPNWFLSIRTPERLTRTYGLFDPARDSGVSHDASTGTGRSGATRRLWKAHCASRVPSAVLSRALLLDTSPMLGAPRAD